MNITNEVFTWIKENKIVQQRKPSFQNNVQQWEKSIISKRKKLSF